MNTVLGIKTEYELMKSLIKIPDLINYLKEFNIKNVGIIDEYLFSSIPLYRALTGTDIKLAIGLPIIINDTLLYLYAKNYIGYQNLLKINTIKQQRDVSILDLNSYYANLILVIPYESISNELNLTMFKDVFYSYKNSTEKELVKSPKVFLKPIRYFNKSDFKYLEYLTKIDEIENTFSNDYFETDDDDSNKFMELIDFEIPSNKRFIPVYSREVDSKVYLSNLAHKGLNKRLNNVLNDTYLTRLEYELSVIDKMGFNDYFLIVYDYVLFAKKNKIEVGPGRGSGAGSLVCYSLGITNIDPIKYDLLFERFLNPERITMPDIDIDFEFNRREEVINYVKQKYGINNTSTIITFSTLKSKILLRLLSKIIGIDETDFNHFIRLIDADLSIKDNFNKPLIKNNYGKNSKYVELYNAAQKLENLKHFPSTHAAGIVISSNYLDEIIPIYIDGDNISTGVTMEYLEDLGLLKMDFLALKNLSIISDIVNELKEYGNNLDINNIPLDDKLTLDLFNKADTLGVFQFESSGMINFLKKLKVKNFNDLYDALALFRPGPMQNIDIYIERRNGKKFAYLSPLLEPILKSTYGIIVYQEQIMEIMVKLGNFSYSEADMIRRAMSKKKKQVIEEYRDKFINGCLENCIPEKTALDIYSMVLKFASYGFNKSHSVSYALISYREAYLKSHYSLIYLKYLLNGSIGASLNTKEYIDYAKYHNVTFIKPDVNLSNLEYGIYDNKMVMPFSLIKGIGSKIFRDIIDNRGVGYLDIFDFAAKNPSIKETTFINLIKSGIFDNLGFNKQTLISNIDIILNYGALAANLGNLLEKPILEDKLEFSNNELITFELDTYGFLIRDHQVSKFNSSDIVKINDLNNNFNKEIKCVFLVENVKKTKTKNNDDMLIINVSDETGRMTLFIFKPLVNTVNINVNDIISVIGLVGKRYNEYQINVKSIKILEDI